MFYKTSLCLLLVDLFHDICKKMNTPHYQLFSYLCGTPDKQDEICKSLAVNPNALKKNIELGLYMNPFYSNITVHILCTIFYTFPKVLTRRICSTIKSLFSWWSFPLFLCPKCVIQWGYCKEKLDASTSLGTKG